MRKYKNKAMEELASELCSGLVRLRKGYVDAAESLQQLIEDQQDYSHEFVVFKLTGYRPVSPGGLMKGRDLRTDLQSLMLDVCDSFELYTRDYDETLFDSTALARRFNVSTKTIQRWRKRGLAARRLFFPDGKRRIGFLESSVAAFLEGHSTEVQRSTQFSQLTDNERDEIIRRARRMASFTDCSLGEVARRIARKLGRAAETVRYTIRKHDSESPERAIFPHLLQTLGEQEKRRIYRSFLRGVAIADLAEQYHRTRSSIHRIVNEMRAKQLIQRPISYEFNDEFQQADADAMIMQDPDEANESAPKGRAKTVKPPRDLPPYLKSLYDTPLLSPAKERALFRRYNYLKYKADQLRKKIDLSNIRVSEVKEVESLLLESNVVKNQIIRANLRLVVSIAKKHLKGPLNLFELVSDGNISLMRAVEKFDYSRGFRFSTYASWAIMRNFARSVPKEKYQLDRFATGHEGVVDIAASLRSYNPMEDNPAELRESIDVMMKHLTSRERTILIEHYGLDQAHQAKTFEQLGKDLGISKERVRQIEIQALEKLRDIVDPEEEL
jgi:RNA polymerase primary sigma factor